MSPTASDRLLSKNATLNRLACPAMLVACIIGQTATAVTPDDPNDLGASVVVPFEAAIDTWHELYVDPVRGDDSLNDGSATAPLRSLAAAMSRAIGQTTPEPTRVHLAGGNYRGLGAYADVRRTAAAPVVISGAIDAQGEPLTVVDGGANGADPKGALCLRLSAIAYVVVENVSCRNAFPHGVNVDDAGNYSSPTHHVVFRNWRIRNVGLYENAAIAGNSDCIKLSGVDDFWIIESEITNCAKGEFIDMVGSHRGVIARNYFHDKPGNGIQAKGGSDRILITRNTLERVEHRFIQLGGSTDEEYYRPSDAPHPASRIDVIANIVRDAGIYNDRDDNATVVFSLNGCSDCLIAHNTVVAMQFQAASAYIDKEDASRAGNKDVTLASNIYVMDDRRNRPRTSAKNALEIRVSARGRPTASAIRFRNEVYFDVDDPATNPVHLHSSVLRGQFEDIGVFDPQLEGDARLRRTSPAIGFGATGYEDRVTADYLGNVYLRPPAAGAFGAPSGASVSFDFSAGVRRAGAPCCEGNQYVSNHQSKEALPK